MKISRNFPTKTACLARQIYKIFVTDLHLQFKQLKVDKNSYL